MSCEVYDRRSTLGSSDIAKVLGLSNWGDAWDVWLEKTGRTETSEGFSGDQAAGNMMEDAVAREMGKRMDLIFDPGPALSEPPNIGEEPWMSARVDFRGRVWKGRSWKCGLEVKTLRSFGDDWGPDGSDLFPPDKAAQVVWQQAVDDSYPFTMLAAWGWSSYELRTYRIERDKSVEKALVERMRGWWHDYVEKDTPPPVTGSKGCSSGLAKLFPTPKKKTYRGASDLEIRLVDAYKRQVDAEKSAQKEKRELGNLIKQAIGSDYGLKAENGSPIIICYHQGKGKRLKPLQQDESE